MFSQKKKPPAQSNRPLAVSSAVLETRIKKYFNDLSLQILDVQESEITYQRSTFTILSALTVTYKTDRLASQQMEIILNQIANPNRLANSRRGWRNQTLYATLLDFLPIKMPAIIAADPGGKWLMLEKKPGGKAVNLWSRQDYLNSITLMARLHDQFWGLGEDLQNFNFLDRPLELDYSSRFQLSRRAIYLINNAQSQIEKNSDLGEMFNFLVGHADEIASRLQAMPATLLQGYYWPGNLIIYPPGDFYAIDWQKSAIGPGILDLVLFIQECKWWFENIPLSYDELIQQYRSQISILRNINWSQEEWELLWDYAILWTFMVDWIEPLTQAPISHLQELDHLLKRVWYDPLKKIISKRFH